MRKVLFIGGPIDGKIQYLPDQIKAVESPWLDENLEIPCGKDSITPKENYVYKIVSLSVGVISKDSKHPLENFFFFGIGKEIEDSDILSKVCTHLVKNLQGILK